MNELIELNNNMFASADIPLKMVAVSLVTPNFNEIGKAIIIPATYEATYNSLEGMQKCKVAALANEELLKLFDPANASSYDQIADDFITNFNTAVQNLSL